MTALKNFDSAESDDLIDVQLSFIAQMHRLPGAACWLSHLSWIETGQKTWRKCECDWEIENKSRLQLCILNFDFVNAIVIYFATGKFKKYMWSYMKRKSMWALCQRLELRICGNNTNNFCEAAMRVLKDKILERTKAFSVPQLADYMSTFLQDYYQTEAYWCSQWDVCRMSSLLDTCPRTNRSGIRDIRQVIKTEHSQWRWISAFDKLEGLSTN